MTGASGFIGEHLVRRLVDSGATVHGCGRREPADTDCDRWWQGDLSDPAFVRRMVSESQPAVLFNLASCVTGRRELEWVRPTLSGNLVSTVNVLEAAAEVCEKPPTLVMAGSMEEPVGSIADAIPASPYAVSKHAASAYTRLFAALYELPAVVARIFMVYGPGQKDLRKLVPMVCLAAHRGESPALMSGTRPVDWIHVDDVVSGLLVLGSGPVRDGRHVDLGSGELVTTGDLATRICRLAEGDVEPRLGAVEDRAMEQVRRADVAGTLALTGWKPAIGLDEGLAGTYRWYAGRMDRGLLNSPGDEGRVRA